MIPMRRLGRLSEGEMQKRSRLLLDEVGSATNCRARAGISPVANNSASRWLARWPTIRALSSRMSPPAISTAQIPDAPSNCCSELCSEERKALLLVTHNPAIAEACDWIHEMQDGLIVGSHPRGRR